MALDFEVIGIFTCVVCVRFLAKIPETIYPLSIQDSEDIMSDTEKSPIHA